MNTDDQCSLNTKDLDFIFEYENDSSKDVFSIGRETCYNDFVVPGQLLPGPLGYTSGPTSRFACRIECMRKQPYSCFVYAGAFDHNNKVCTRNTFVLFIMYSI
jgi:hypothetical protein